jgi:hypothetical protein
MKSGGFDLAVQEFSLANSALGLWPRTPSLSKDGLDVSFVGGVPGGFNIEGATMFKIIFLANKEGTVTISTQYIGVYANDGKGTKSSAKMQGVTITIKPKKVGTPVTNDWTSVVTADKTLPENFIVVLGQDPSLFSNEKFAFFSAVDNQSGISYYDVSENGAPAVRSGSMYVLQNQSGDVNLTVTAYDKAGNKRVVTYSKSASFFSGVSWPTVVLGVIVILLIIMGYKKWRKNKRNAYAQ